jgi:hypothetical protein
MRGNDAPLFPEIKRKNTGCCFSFVHPWQKTPALHIANKTPETRREHESTG